MLGEHLQQSVGNVDGALEVVLRQPDLDRAVEAPGLPPHVDPAAEEVDVADLEGGGLPEPHGDHAVADGGSEYRAHVDEPGPYRARRERARGRGSWLLPRRR